MSVAQGNSKNNSLKLGAKLSRALLGLKGKTKFNASIKVNPKCYLGPIDNNSFIKDVSWPNADSKSLDLSTYNSLSFIESKLAKLKAKRLDITGLLESLRDPRITIKALRKWLIEESGRELEINVNSSDQNFIDDIILLLSCSGINQSIKDGRIIAKCSLDYYKKFLSDNYMPELGFKHLLVSTEHSDYRIKGGLGSYIKECYDLYGDEQAMLIIDETSDLDVEFIKRNKWFSVQSLIGSLKLDKLREEDEGFIYGLPIMEAIRNICFYYDFDSAEFFEAGAHRVIQAKASGMLPQNLNIVTTCHGSIFHLFNCRREMMNPVFADYALREKYTIEQSDLTIFPTKYLMESYAKLGIKANNPIIRRLPINLNSVSEGGDSDKCYDNFIYIGKTNTTKGFDILLETLIKIAKATENRPKVVKCFVTSVEVEDANLMPLLEEAKKYYDIKLDSLKRDQLMIVLNNLASNSIALLPYPGDNHPLVVLELMHLGLDFIAIDAGGTPELVKQDMREYYIGPRDSDSLANMVINELGKSKLRSERIRELRSWYKKEQLAINNSYKASFFKDVVDDAVESVSENILNPRLTTHLLISVNSKIWDEYHRQITKLINKLKAVSDTKIYVDNKYIANKLELDIFEATEVWFKKFKTSIKPYDSIILANQEIPKADFIYKLRASTKGCIAPMSSSRYINELIKNRDLNKQDPPDLINRFQPTGFLNILKGQFGCNIGGRSLGIVDISEFNFIDIDSFFISPQAFYSIMLNNSKHSVNLIPENLAVRFPLDKSMIDYNSEILLNDSYIISPFDKYLIASASYYGNMLGDSIQNRHIAASLHLTFGTYDTPHISKLVKLSRVIDIYNKKVPLGIKKTVSKGSNLTARVLGKLVGRRSK